MTERQRREAALIVKGRFRGQPSFFLLDLEPQAQPQAEFARRMFTLGAAGEARAGPGPKRELISGFIGAYLRLTMEEQAEFEAELTKMDPQRREQVMEIVTGWMERGMETVCLRLLRKRLGSVDADSQNRIEQLTVDRLEELAKALLEFNSPSDLIAWLDAHCPR